MSDSYGEMGCPYRKWGWHDGGPEHGCTRGGRDGFCCEDSWADWYQCEAVNEEIKASADNGGEG